jgi:hypothetical protein
MKRLKEEVLRERAFALQYRGTQSWFVLFRWGGGTAGEEGEGGGREGGGHCRGGRGEGGGGTAGEEGEGRGAAACTLHRKQG